MRHGHVSTPSSCVRGSLDRGPVPNRALYRLLSRLNLNGTGTIFRTKVSRRRRHRFHPCARSCHRAGAVISSRSGSRQNLRDARFRQNLRQQRLRCAPDVHFVVPVHARNSTILGLYVAPRISCPVGYSKVSPPGLAEVATAVVSIHGPHGRLILLAFTHPSPSLQTSSVE
jgi:hypothetical protein